ncbi:MAG: hypothetical protein PF450_06340, partial [Bacteroidales bacterium]|nr:hypothetical protein [Bacteroidales bacterium]
MKISYSLLILFSGLISISSSCKEEVPPEVKAIELAGIRVDSIYLSLNEMVHDIPVDKNIYIEFSSTLDTNSVEDNL